MNGLPETVGRYRLIRELGRGMMGVVWLAKDPDLGRDIALKIIQLPPGANEAERASFEQRFFSEAQSAARLTHPGIVIVHDVGRDPASGALFMALQLLPGQTLDHVLKTRKRLEWQEALRITRKVAEALEHAHSEGVVHRDIKPANIMVLPSGDPKIMDFGIAKIET
ncbi:MAG TPA: serine/threonine-protein kinase, partial [Vicinamibacteria bacterium]|nr:serine/threonine-protein kinase [Vicinamibacteria bacterium]